MENSKITFEKFFNKADLKKYVKYPFDMPESVESFTISYKANTNKKCIDLIIIDNDGIQIGTICSNRRAITISERNCTLGSDIRDIKAGVWQLVIGLNSFVNGGIQTVFNIEFTYKKKRWLKGDTHLHTAHSDGKYLPSELLRKCRKKGLDFAIITDHNTNTGGKARYNNADILAIQGYELTNYLGHINFWGIEKPFDGVITYDNFDDFLPLVNQGYERGATISLNHITCKKNGWELPLEGFPYHSVEVWNGPMRIDNITAIKWWHNQLLRGRKLPAVGGSDYHNDFVVTSLLAQPTMAVYADSNTTTDILKAIRQGNSFITYKADKTMLYLTSKGLNVGETILFLKGIKVNIEADKLKKGHRLIIYNNDEIIFDYKSKHTRKFTAEIEVKEKGFVRAEIQYTKNFIERKIHKVITKFLLPADVNLPVPPFVWALTNPIYFE